MMARLKSLDLKICFDTSFSFIPLKIKFNSKTINLKKGKTFLPLVVSLVDQKIDIKFEGYSPEDKHQKIIVDIYHDDTKLDTTILSTFIMEKNLYVNNILLNNYKEICFNGCLTLSFFKEWFECNLLAGCYINDKKTGYLNWRISYKDNCIDRNREKILKKYNTICIGASITHGTDHLSPINAWPGQLQKILNIDVGNFGIGGADHFTVMHNIEYIINNFDVERIIVLLPPSFILPMRVSLLGNYVFLFSAIQNEKIYKPLESLFKIWKKKNILKEKYIKNFLSKKLKKIENMCDYRNIELCLIHQNVGYRDEFDYNSAKIKNFVFPTWTTIQSLEDGHPDETVHLNFTKILLEKIYENSTIG